MDVCVPDTATWTPPDGADSGQVDLANQYAWVTMQMLSAYQIALCAVQVRPCAARWIGSYEVAPTTGPDGAPFFPMVMPGGNWINVVCTNHGPFGGNCMCEWVPKITLPGPIGGITEIMIDGAVLAPTAYRVEGNQVIRQDGQQWPFHQNMALAAGQVGTFTVTYFRGSVPDNLVNSAAGIMANEYYLGLTNDKACRLPRGTQTIVRQGITIQIDKDWFENGSTGIVEVDMVLRRFNPYRQKTPSFVMSPDSLSRAKQTTFGW